MASRISSGSPPCPISTASARSVVPLGLVTLTRSCAASSALAASSDLLRSAVDVAQNVEP